MGRDGKPMGVLTVMAFSLQKVSKDGQRESVVEEPQSASTAAQAIADSAKGATRRQVASTVAAATPLPPATSAQQANNTASRVPPGKKDPSELAFPEIDESYLRLVA